MLVVVVSEQLGLQINCTSSLMYRLVFDIQEHVNECLHLELLVSGIA